MDFESVLLFTLPLRTAKAPTGAQPGRSSHTNLRKIKIMNLTPFTPSPGRRLPGTNGKSYSENGSTDRDGVRLPATPMIVVYMCTLVRGWVNHHPVDYTEHPLPNVDVLNAAIARPWPLGLDGK